MAPELKEQLEARIPEEMGGIRERIGDLEENTKPIAPHQALGRLTWLDGSWTSGQGGCSRTSQGRAGAPADRDGESLQAGIWALPELREGDRVRTDGSVAREHTLHRVCLSAPVAKFLALCNRRSPPAC